MIRLWLAMTFLAALTGSAEAQAPPAGGTMASPPPVVAPPVTPAPSITTTPGVTHRVARDW